ncbi:MAG: phosphoribosylglycinamide formyltransferase [Candidatus Omnitrophica bacterium]|nr:phosphoribosylglycinamide formyltransferase [Candidatus Omnitrophota bacterium]
MNFAVLASGNGSNLQAIINACRKGKVRAKLAAVISDRSQAFALERARKAKVPCVLPLDPKGFQDREDFDRRLVEILAENKVDFVVLAGFMRILSPYFIQSFRDRILNIHPALLPAFKGGHAIADALAYGVKVTGVTVHFVDEEVDHGPIILQEAVAIRPKDTAETLAFRIHKVEHRLYPAAIDLFARGKLRLAGRVVRIG